MASYRSIVDHYIERFVQGEEEQAFHGLREMDHDVLPELSEAFRTAPETETRVFLLNVIWEHRQQSAIPILLEGLFDAEPSVWQEAMDGLVALSSHDSLDALSQARNRHFAVNRDKIIFSDWLEEAIEQVEQQLGSCNR